MCCNSVPLALPMIHPMIQVSIYRKGNQKSHIKKRRDKGISTVQLRDCPHRLPINCKTYQTPWKHPPPTLLVTPNRRQPLRLDVPARMPFLPIMEDRLIPRALERHRWVQKRQTRRSKHDHDAFHNHEHNLIAHEQRPVESPTQLHASVHAPREDHHAGDHQTNQEGLEEPRLDKGHVSGVPQAPVLHDAQGELSGCGPE